MKYTASDYQMVEFQYPDLIEKYMRVNKISFNEAVDLILFDMYEADEETVEEEASKAEEKKAKAEKKAKVGIQEDELEMIKEVIKAEFPEREFKNKELHIFVSDKLSVRQTPSRLKRLVNEGFLVDCGGSPKSYKLS